MESQVHWSPEEVQALITVWADDNVQRDLETSVRNEKVYREISKKLQEMGVVRSVKQCREKIKKLKQEYRKIKDSNNNNNGNSFERKSASWYNAMDAVLRQRSGSSGGSLLDSATVLEAITGDADSCKFTFLCKMQSQVHWTSDEVQALLAVWADDNVQRDLETNVRNEKVYREIAKKLEDMGIMRTVKQCREKIKKLKQEYKKIKEYNRRSGTERKSASWYSAMDSVLGQRQVSSNGSTLDSTTVFESISGDTETCSSEQSSELTQCLEVDYPSDSEVAVIRIPQTPESSPEKMVTPANSQKKHKSILGKRRRDTGWPDICDVLREVDQKNQEMLGKLLDQRERHLQLLREDEAKARAAEAEARAAQTAETASFNNNFIAVLGQLVQVLSRGRQ
ncbi:zinc finger and SCAN domain-containing protein 29-like [Polypterus senegalus]|uniref:zinc finger and SCAN domain-containing protein 29-like n=1 Tax=Polypterus senegalus TaxID=55291 RepID=UPI0019663BD1|nr:zinc finger and SCAN domain-containing protein 29-like [Polypterus senegalus]